MTDIANLQRLNEVLGALAEQLAARNRRHELFVVGGSALLALRIISRPTKDVDVVAVRVEGTIRKADPLPPDLISARDRVGRDFGLPTNWLNAGPAGLVDFGLPEGFVDRVQTEIYSTALIVHFASRLDQIHLKLYALVDQGAGRHEQDLQALEPTSAELVQAARWTRTHDPSPGFRQMLEAALRHLGVEDADLGT
jgi:hypothetical protein